MFIEMEKKNSQKLKKFPSSLWKMVKRSKKRAGKSQPREGGEGMINDDHGVEDDFSVENRGKVNW